MGTVAGVTAQLNNIGGCSSADCCSKIAALEQSVRDLQGQQAQTIRDLAKLEYTLIGYEAEFAKINQHLIAIESGIVAIVAIAAAPLIAAAVAPALAAIGTLGSSIAGAIASIGVIQGEIVAIGGTAGSALALAGTAEGTAVSALALAGTAEGTAVSALALAGTAEGTAVSALALAGTAEGTAVSALALAGTAEGTAVSALALGGTAQATAIQALTKSSIPGQPGQPGSNGTKGDKGDKGDNGDKGDKGDKGEAGGKGDKGDKGDKGEAGDKGDKGEAGGKGDKGEAGGKGDKGEAGGKGDKGEAGGKGDKGEAGDKGKDAEVKFINIDVKKFDKCEQETPKFTTNTVSVIDGTQLLEQAKFERLAEIEAQQCANCDCVATMPEWWQVRFEGGTPQLILSYRELRLDGTIGEQWYPITIPHPIITNPTTLQLAGSYRKGNWQILLTLNDNSKVILNVEEEQAGLDFLDSQIKPLINPNYLTNAKIKTAHFPDSGFVAMRVLHRHTDYFATGNRKLKPTWRRTVK